MFHNFPVKRKSNMLENVETRWKIHGGLQETKKQKSENLPQREGFQKFTVCHANVKNAHTSFEIHIFFIYICMHTYIYLHVVLGETPDCAPTIWGMMARRKSACGDTSFLVKEQSQPITKCCCWSALPASATAFSFTLHTKVILQFASYFPRL